jgi:DNA-binding MarR family transcriptional regulator
VRDDPTPSSAPTVWKAPQKKKIRKYMLQQQSSSRILGMSMAAPSFQSELRKRAPFDLPQQEAYLNIVRTQAILAAEFDRLFRRHGLSASGYNVLRILRGAADGGQPWMPCCDVAARLVAQVPDLTRLVDRLEREGFVKRDRDGDDRRVVRLSITPAARKLLATLDQPTLDLHRAQLGHLTGAELSTLSRLLMKARRRPASNAESAT